MLQNWMTLPAHSIAQKRTVIAVSQSLSSHTYFQRRRAALSPVDRIGCLNVDPGVVSYGPTPRRLRPSRGPRRLRRCIPPTQHVCRSTPQQGLSASGAYELQSAAQPGALIEGAHLCYVLNSLPALEVFKQQRLVAVEILSPAPANHYINARASSPRRRAMNEYVPDRAPVCSPAPAKSLPLRERRQPYSNRAHAPTSRQRAYPQGSQCADELVMHLRARPYPTVRSLADQPYCNPNLRPSEQDRLQNCELTDRLSWAKFCASSISKRPEYGKTSHAR